MERKYRQDYAGTGLIADRRTKKQKEEDTIRKLNETAGSEVGFNYSAPARTSDPFSRDPADTSEPSAYTSERNKKNKQPKVKEQFIATEINRYIKNGYTAEQAERFAERNWKIENEGK